MNYLIISYNLLLLISVRANDMICKNNITDIKHNEVDLSSFCSSEKPCIVKCCGENEVIYNKMKNITCANVEVVKKELGGNLSHIHFDYSDVMIYNNDIYKSVELSTKKFKDFTWLYSKTFANLDSCTLRVKGMKLLENGILMDEKPNYYEYWHAIDTSRFCVDMMVGKVGDIRKSVHVFRIIPDDKESSDIKNYFNAIAMLISSFFLLLVLVVYSILHQLRNIQGMLLTAYVASLMCAFVLKASQLLYSDAEHKSHKNVSMDCTFITQMTYFFILASFFWLKLMSFDIWWTFRGTRKLREIHRRGINIKFMIYASYAYGVPAAMTIFAAIMDKQDLPAHVVKPFFNKCFVSDTFFVYLYVPLMILTGCNCLLFLMTMYNIWLIGRNMKNFDKTTVQKNKKNQNMFLLYIKLSLLMGVSWILELIQSQQQDDKVPVWQYILMNAYNMLIGVIIFFMFVFKTNIFAMLCKRFNIENRWTRRHFKVNSSTRSELSKSSKSYSRSYSRTRSTADSDVEDGTGVRRTEDSIPLKSIEGTKNGRLNAEFTAPVIESEH